MTPLVHSRGGSTSFPVAGSTAFAILNTASDMAIEMKTEASASSLPGQILQGPYERRIIKQDASKIVPTTEAEADGLGVENALVDVLAVGREEAVRVKRLGVWVVLRVVQHAPRIGDDHRALGDPHAFIFILHHKPVGDT